jgi:hypothetical protein
VLHGRLLDKNSYSCEALTDLSYPVILLQGGKSRGDRLIESLRGDLYGVLNVSKIPDRNCARSKNHTRDGSIFAFCSLRPERGTVRVRSVRLSNHLNRGDDAVTVWAIRGEVNADSGMIPNGVPG